MKKTILNTLTITCLLTILPLGLQANPDDREKDGPKDLEAVFGKLDKNDDGKLRLKEFANGKHMENRKPEAVANIFEERDLNSDGEISLREFEKTFGKDKRGPGKGKKGGKMGKGGKGGKGGGN